jgi:hypothetical protein
MKKIAIRRETIRKGKGCRHTMLRLNWKRFGLVANPLTPDRIFKGKKKLYG